MKKKLEKKKKIRKKKNRKKKICLGLIFFGPNNFHNKYIWRRSFGLPLRKEMPHSSTPSTGNLGDSYHMLLHLDTRKSHDHSVTWIFQVSNREVFLTREIKGALPQHTCFTHKASTYKLQQKEKFKELSEEGLGVFNTIRWNEAKLVYWYLR